jgi:hypothetical protein
MRAKVECEPYQSGSAMARDIRLPKTYVLVVPKKVLKLNKYSLRWVPQTLNDDQKAARVEMAASMLNILERLTAHVRSCPLTGDEAWFYFSCDYEGKWALARDPSMTKPNVLINTPNIMVLVR